MGSSKQSPLAQNPKNSDPCKFFNLIRWLTFLYIFNSICRGFECLKCHSMHIFPFKKPNENVCMLNVLKYDFQKYVCFSAQSQYKRQCAIFCWFIYSTSRRYSQLKYISLVSVREGDDSTHGTCAHLSTFQITDKLVLYSIIYSFPSRKYWPICIDFVSSWNVPFSIFLLYLRKHRRSNQICC